MTLSFPSFPCSLIWRAATWCSSSENSNGHPGSVFLVAQFTLCEHILWKIPLFVSSCNSLAWKKKKHPVNVRAAKLPNPNTGTSCGFAGVCCPLILPVCSLAWCWTLYLWACTQKSPLKEIRFWFYQWTYKKEKGEVMKAFMKAAAAQRSSTVHWGSEWGIKSHVPWISWAGIA